jgi:hypothetical protein
LATIETPHCSTTQRGADDVSLTDTFVFHRFRLHSKILHASFSMSIYLLLSQLAVLRTGNMEALRLLQRRVMPDASQM